MIVEQALGTLNQCFRCLLFPLTFYITTKPYSLLACITLYNFVVRTDGGFLQVSDLVEVAVEEEGDVPGEAAPP